MNLATGLEPRLLESHKGDYGRLLLVGGCRHMSGAIALSASAALRSGAGLVTVATAVSAQPVVAGYNPCYMTIGLNEDTAGKIVVSATELQQVVAGFMKYDVLVMGPGLSQSESLVGLVDEIYRKYDGPVVIDADGLNNLTSLAGPGGARILTPHPGEFKRLLEMSGKQPADTREQQEQQAREVAMEYGVTVLLKGNATLVTDGVDSYHNATGNPGMATAGSGDVLTGVIAALLAQQGNPLNAARLGAHIHGLAGDLAVKDVGEVSLIATDLIDYLPAAFQYFQMET